MWLSNFVLSNVIIPTHNHHKPFPGNIFTVPAFSAMFELKSRLLILGRSQSRSRILKILRFSLSISCTTAACPVDLQQLPALKVAQTFKSTLAVTLSALEASFIAEHL